MLNIHFKSVVTFIISYISYSFINIVLSFYVDWLNSFLEKRYNLIDLSVLKYHYFQWRQKSIFWIFESTFLTVISLIQIQSNFVYVVFKVLLLIFVGIAFTVFEIKWASETSESTSEYDTLNNIAKTCWKHTACT